MDLDIFWIIVTICTFGIFLPFVSGGETYADETALRAMLKSGYDQEVRPSTPTAVNMFYSLRTLQTLDITNQAMHTTGWLSLFWEDPRLVWNATDYSNITDIDANWIWRPEVFASNTNDDPYYGGYVNDNVRFRVFNTGRVRWIVPLPLTTTCDVNIATFPFDSQSCYVELFFFGLNDVDVEPNITTEIMTQSYITNAEWQYDGGHVSTSVIPVCCPATNFSLVYVNLNFTRLRPFYVINLIIPSMLLSVCMVLAFLLPTDCGERLGYSLTILLSYTVVLTITTDMMPTTSKQTPVINLYLLVLLVLCSLSVLNVVMNVQIFHWKSTPPRRIQSFVLKAERIVYLKCRRDTDKVSPTVSSSDDVENHNTKCEKNQIPYDINRVAFDKDRTAFDSEDRSNLDVIEEVTWIQLSELFDRICFYFYTMANLILLMLFLLGIYGKF